jgi:hypothetical protein
MGFLFAFGVASVKAMNLCLDQRCAHVVAFPYSGLESIRDFGA